MKIVNIKTLFSLPSLLNIVGIAIAIAAFYVLMSLADNEFNFNQSIDRHEDIYQFSTSRHGSQGSSIMRPLPERLGSSIASVESFGCIQTWWSDGFFVNRDGNYNSIATNYSACSKSILDVFGFRILEGDTSKFQSRRQMIVTRSFADRIGLSVGEMVLLDLNDRGKNEVEIVAVYDDFERNTEFGHFDGFLCLGDENINNHQQWNYTYYMKAVPGAASLSDGIEESVKQIVRDFYRDDPAVTDVALEKELEDFRVHFVPIDQLHFHEQIGGYHRHFDKKLAYTIVILAVFVIVIAFINYFNFFMARVPLRLKSINTRKVLGGSRDNLIAEVVGESVTFTVVSMLLAAVIVYVVLSSLLDGIVNMDVYVYSNYKALIITILTALGASILTSLYPAFYITSIPPAMALKGQMTRSRDSVVRYLLIGFQVAASVLLIICALFVNRNNDFLMTRDIGFDRDNILSTYTTIKIAESRETVRSKLLENPDITDITWTSQNVIQSARMSWGREKDGNDEDIIYFEVCPVAYNFLDFMKIDMVEGRNFTQTDELCENGAIIFNETARQQLSINLDNQIGGHADTVCTLAGFCKDFNYRPLQYGVGSFAFYVFGKNPWQPLRHLYVRTTKTANAKNTIDYIRTALAEIDPDYEILHSQIIPFEKELENNYGGEKRIQAMVTIFTIIAIIISVMGIFGIVLFDTERRRKEIGIRKVNGATVVEILAMFNRKFLILTAICSVVAIPLAYVIVNAYFSQFAYHYAVNAWPFILGVLMAMIVTSVVVSGASFKAANENPVKTLKTE